MWDVFQIDESHEDADIHDATLYTAAPLRAVDILCRKVKIQS